MHNHLDALAAIAIPGSAILGSKASVSALGLLSEASGVILPEWAAQIGGPLGTLVALGIALKWMTNRLAASEEKADKRETERTTQIETLHTSHSEKMEALTLSALKVTDKVSRSLDAVVEELRNRPCGLGLKKPNQEQP